jgi:Zn-dependent protease
MTRGLRFRLFGIPFVAQIWFFLTLLLICINRLDNLSVATGLKLAWFASGIVIAGLSVVVHELGHCFAYRRYHQQPSVMLWGLGGLTFGEQRLPPRRSIVVSLAGPFTAMVVLGIPGWILDHYVIRTSYGGDLSLLPKLIVYDLWWFALVWSLINCLPILPLDGGHVCEAILELIHGEPRKQTARLVSMIAGFAFGLFGVLYLGSAFLLLFGWGLAVLNGIPWWQERNNSLVRYELLPDEDSAGVWMGGGDANVVSMDKARKKRDRRAPGQLVADGYDALERRDYKAALRIADRLDGKRLNAEQERSRAELAALAWLGERNPGKAEAVLAAAPRNGPPSVPVAAALAVASKQIDDGITLMVRCMLDEPEGGPKLVAVDLFAEYGMIHRLARELVDLDGGVGFESAVALEGMLHRLHRTQDASTVSDVILLG